MRPGVWARPDNLDRAWPGPMPGRVWRFTGRPEFDEPRPADLAARLWDLSGWADGAEALVRAMRGGREPAERFVAAAAIVRHLRDDPVLPPALLPRGWPGARLRAAYDDYRRELGEMLTRERARSAR